MNQPPAPNASMRHRFPAEILGHGMWLYCRFCLSSRDVEELRAERGVVLIYEAVRYGCRTFGQTSANQLRRRRRWPGDTWSRDEVVLTLNKPRHYLWRAVDQDGHPPDILVPRRRDKKAAKKFFRKRQQGLTYVPRVIITDKLRSDGAARREMLPGVDIARTAPSTTAPNTPTNRPARGSGGCRGSSPPGTPRVFSPPLGSLPNMSGHGAPCSRPPRTAKS